MCNTAMHTRLANHLYDILLTSFLADIPKQQCTVLKCYHCQLLIVKLLSIISPPYPQHIALEKYSTQSAEQVVDFNYCNITWPTAPRVSAWSAAMNSVTADSVDSFSKVNRQERGKR